eukprot:TRINITY_DN3637_c0_g1_i2.p1 TRINITY_DN3637_c0_g1~~TRINITY_DN3637_c0_g1_i2.p1  ORF type:complete len:211 (+),score=44.21 TRINITY_DN3637_c0_g1_i2:42-674(+)
MTVVVCNRKPFAEVFERSQLSLIAASKDEEEVKEEISRANGEGATSLRLSNFEELTRIPDEIGDLTKVYRIHIDNNYVLTKMPSAICNLAERLEELNLSYNSIEELPLEICQLKYLQRLNVSNNKLRYMPTDIDQLRYLEELCIDNNFITAFPPNLGYMKKLQKFFISNNPLVDEDDSPYQPYHPPTVTECDLCKAPLSKDTTLVGLLLP